MSKAEKRIARRAEEEQIRLEKKALEVEKILAARRPEQTTDPKVAKIPVEYDGGSRSAHQVVVEKEHADREGVWSWGQQRDWHPDPGEPYVNKLLADWCIGKTWGEVESATVKSDGELRHISYTLDKICDEAYYRLIELKLDDHDEIFRFRTAGKERLYGFIVGVKFQMVWYDPHHMIYPLASGSSFTAPRAAPPEPAHRPRLSSQDQHGAPEADQTDA